MSLEETRSECTLGTWVRSDPTDIIGTTVGGNRYGWFVQNEIDDLAIDNSQRTGRHQHDGLRDQDLGRRLDHDVDY